MAKVYPTGEVIGGKVQITEMICVAGQAITYRAVRIPEGDTVFLKQLNADLKTTNGEIALKRFQREQSIVIDSPQVPKNLGNTEFDGAFFTITEFIEGQSLDDYLAAIKTPLPNEEVARITQGVAKVLQIAHKEGIIHRDIKAANVMLAKDGRIVVVDWGLCRFIDSKTIHPGSDPMGTIFYMSPEHIKNKGIDRQSDLFSLGVLAYVCLTQRYPFDGTDEKEIFESILYADPVSPRSINPAVDAGLESIVRRLLQKEKTRRYPDAEALLIDLEEGFGACEPGDRCRSCGEPVASGVKFCMRCGAALTTETEPFDGMLIILNGAMTGRSLSLSASGIEVGRYVLAPDDDFVSRHHARFFYADGRHWIEDLGSLNGTSVNGLAIPKGGRHPLIPGDRVRLADTFCEFNR